MVRKEISCISARGEGLGKGQFDPINLLRAQVKLQVNPQQQGQNSNQNKGHQGVPGIYSKGHFEKIKPGFRLRS